jgi:peptide chain release factor 2
MWEARKTGKDLHRANAFNSVADVGTILQTRYRTTWMTWSISWKKRKPESKTSWCVFDITARESELQKLERAAEDPTLWEDPNRARKTMSRVAKLRQSIQGWRSLQQRVDDALELASLNDESMRSDIEQEIDAARIEIERRELQVLFSGPYDRDDAILSIYAGAGGTDSQDWAAMLQRMYLRWMEAHDFEAQILDASEGEEAGIKSVTIAVAGEFAYGQLQAEKGVHRLVRLSPFDSTHRRHTSFALVEVYPQVESDDGVEILASDLKIDTFRSAGPGGQNVQKNATAVRITHLPTNLVVICQNERSQAQNKENALRVLRARLLDIKRQEQEQELAQIKGEHIQAEWGSQIRSYVLHPYQMVKDHRSGHEVGNATAVLDGDLDGFIESYLRTSLGQSK